jgi:hypothetical protein
MMQPKPSQIKDARIDSKIESAIGIHHYILDLLSLVRTAIRAHDVATAPPLVFILYPTVLVPVVIGEHSALLHAHAGIVFLGVENIPRDVICVHMVNLSLMNKDRDEPEWHVFLHLCFQVLLFKRVEQARESADLITLLPARQ